jgi:uncharacterized NAD-dependent epimerase/dehydratase family protein
LEKALILAEGLFSTTDGKTAHGLVRHSQRFKIVGVIDSTLVGRDISEIVPGASREIRIYGSLEDAVSANREAKHLIVGVATAGGRLPKGYKPILMKALKMGLSITSGLHEFLSDDPKLSELARKSGLTITDVRKIFRDMKWFYTGAIKNVKALKIVILGTDACVGKRTTAITLSEELNKNCVKTIVIGTGQTGWMQGLKYGIVVDAMTNDFITGGIEREVVRAYEDEKPQAIVVPTQGGIIHSVFPGGYEIVSVLGPDLVFLQHAPGRRHPDGFPDLKMPELSRAMKLIELLSGKKVSAIVINNENLENDEAREFAKKYEKRFKVVACIPLIEGVGKLVNLVTERVSVASQKLKK